VGRRQMVRGKGAGKNGEKKKGEGGTDFPRKGCFRELKRRAKQVFTERREKRQKPHEPGDLQNVEKKNREVTF